MNAAVSTSLAVRRARSVRARGLTLVEVLATIVMMAIVLPAAMQGISLCTSTAQTAKQRSEAAALAEAKLSELIATGDWEFGALSGEFGEAWPEYKWSAAAGTWTGDPNTTMSELSVRVYWVSRQQEREVILTTLRVPSEATSTGF
jgi:prepilin-type N-terminal cleavage/methylation domain-containing protein